MNKVDDTEERRPGRSAAQGPGRRRAGTRVAEALFGSWVVEIGAWDVGEAVETVAVAHRGRGIVLRTIVRLSI